MQTQTTTQQTVNEMTIADLEALHLQWIKNAIETGEADHIITVLAELGEVTHYSKGRPPARALWLTIDGMLIHAYYVVSNEGFNQSRNTYNIKELLFVTATAPGGDIWSGRILARLEKLNNQWVDHSNSIFYNPQKDPHLFVPGEWAEMLLSQYPLAENKISARKAEAVEKRRSELAHLLWLDGES